MWQYYKTRISVLSTEDSKIYIMSFPRNLKGGIGSLIDPLCYGAAAILPLTYGGELLYLRIWCDHSARSAHIIVTV